MRAGLAFAFTGYYENPAALARRRATDQLVGLVQVSM
jgi:hypothetical protein